MANWFDKTFDVHDSANADDAATTVSMRRAERCESYARMMSGSDKPKKEHIPGLNERKAIRNLDSHFISDKELRDGYINTARHLDEYENGKLNPEQQLFQARMDYLFGDEEGFPKRKKQGDDDNSIAAFGGTVLFLIALAAMIAVVTGH